jgi:hypothetical protein
MGEQVAADRLLHRPRRGAQRRKAHRMRGAVGPGGRTYSSRQSIPATARRRRARPPHRDAPRRPRAPVPGKGYSRQALDWIGEPK